MKTKRNRHTQTLALAVYYVLVSRLPDLAFPGGRFFNAVRCKTLGLILPQFGDGNEIDSRVYVGDGSDVAVGSRCQINSGCRLARVVISDDVMIGPEVLVIGRLHRSSALDRPMVEQGECTIAPTRIEGDVWVGARAVVMPGVTIGTGSIVGAAAVVTHDVAPGSVVGGVPARLIRTRSDGIEGR